MFTLLFAFVAIAVGVVFCVPKLWTVYVNPLTLTPFLLIVLVGPYLLDHTFMALGICLLLLGLLGLLGATHIFTRRGVVAAMLFAVFTMVGGALFLLDAMPKTGSTDILIDRVIMGVVGLLYGLFMVCVVGLNIKEFIAREPQN
jgi:hypothetical protein